MKHISFNVGMLRPCSVLAATLFLQGCSGEPSESNVREAILRHEKTVLGLSMLFFNPSNRAADTTEAARKFLREAAIKVDGCSQAQNAPGYVCDFRMGSPDGKAMGQPIKGRFFKSDDGWQFDDAK